MAPEVTFELEGMDEFVSRLESWGADALDAADEAVTQAASDAADLARDAVRVRTGDLQRSIQSERVEWGLAVVEAGGPSAPHVRPVEKHSAFFNRSVDTIEQELRGRVAGAIIEAAF